MNRRQFASAVSVGLAATATGANVTASLGQAPVQRPAPIAPDKRLQVAALVYPGMILLDLVGPQTVFNLLRSDVHLVGKTRAPVRTDIGVAIGPTLAIDECPADLDLLFVPGGLEGSVAMMDEKEVLDVLADRGSRARFVTSSAPALSYWAPPDCFGATRQLRIGTCAISLRSWVPKWQPSA